MPTVVNDVWSTTYYDDNSYIITTTDSQDECIDTGEGIVWYYGTDEKPRVAKNLKELLGEPDWEI
jgi:hypothetical protein